MKRKPEDCDHENSDAVGLGYALCNDCGILMPDELPASQLLDNPEEDDAASE